MILRTLFNQTQCERERTVYKFDRIASAVFGFMGLILMVTSGISFSVQKCPYGVTLSSAFILMSLVSFLLMFISNQSLVPQEPPKRDWEERGPYEINLASSIKSEEESMKNSDILELANPKYHDARWRVRRSGHINTLEKELDFELFGGGGRTVMQMMRKHRLTFEAMFRFEQKMRMLVQEFSQ